MRDTVAELVRLVMSGEATGAQRGTLARAGPVALPDMVAAIERSPETGWALRSFLRFTAAPKTLPLLISLARDAEPLALQTGAIEALGHSDHADAYDVLVTLLGESPFFGTVAKAIGSLKDIRGICVLAEAADEILDGNGREGFESLVRECREGDYFDPIRELLSIARASADLGDHSFAYVAVTVAGLDADENDEPELTGEVRPEAARTLHRVVGSGMVGALSTAAAAGQSLELGRAALKGLFLLGSPLILPLLIEHAQSDNVVLASLADQLVRAITGAVVDELEDGAHEAWWQRNEARFDVDCAYRRGELYDPSTQFARLDGAGAVGFTRWDLEMTTGLDLEYTTAIEAQHRWESTTVRPGALYKRGFELNMSEAFADWPH